MTSNNTGKFKNLGTSVASIPGTIIGPTQQKVDMQYLKQMQLLQEHLRKTTTIVDTIDQQCDEIVDVLMS